MATFDRTLFAMYRLTVVDDYEAGEMLAFDIVMGYILIGSFLALAAIVWLNLFIALLSDTFQR